MIRRSSPTNSSQQTWPNGSLLFTLPIGTRPPQRIVGVVPTSAGLIRVDVNTNGQVTLAQDSPSTSYMSISGLYWITN